MDNTKTITHLSLCSGYEGIGLGLRSVLPSLREIAYVEIEAFAATNLVAKMEEGRLDAAPIFTDLKTFPYGKFRGCVDILSGGFPCQPFSAAGQRKGTEDPRHLFPYIKEGIRECRPRIVFLENVEGIISSKTSDGESVLQYVLRELEGLGYIATAGVFSASEIGAPHQRKRVFILGLANSENFGCRGWSNTDRDNGGRIQEQATPEQSILRGEATRCGGDARGEEELGNATSLRPCQLSTDSREAGSDQSGEECGLHEPKGTSALSRYGSQSEELANSQSEGLEGHSRVRSEQDWRCQPSEGSIWPARPTEAQHEWEEPRVTEPKLGRATDGSSSRVDRLRLLGNGVVPATAARAFVTLINRVV